MKTGPLALALALALATSCTPGGSPPGAGSAPVSTSSPVATATASSLSARTLVSNWKVIESTAISGRWIAWSGIETGNARTDPDALALMDRSEGQVRTLAHATVQAGIITFLRMTDDWIVWVEYADRATISDWSVRAARLPSGVPRTLMSARPGGKAEDRPEYALVGHELIVTGRFSQDRHQLVSIDLESGTQRELAAAGPGESFGLPSARDGLVAFESHSSEGDRVLLLDLSSGSVRRFGDGTHPMSEPALMDGWLAYKAARRYESGRIELRRLSGGDPVVPTMFVGEAPVAGSGLFAWKLLTSDQRTSAPPIFCFDPAGRSYVIAPASLAETFGGVAMDRRAILFHVANLEGVRTLSLRLAEVGPPSVR